MEADVIERFKEVRQSMSDQCSSKVDVATLRGEIATQFGLVYVRFAELESNMTRVESILIKWFVATSFALVSITFAIARYVH